MHLTLKSTIACATALIVLSTAQLLRAEVERLTVDARVSPTLGIDSSNPEFGWILSTRDAYDVVQKTRRIKLGISKTDVERSENLLWDSGEIASSQTFGVRYEGEQLESSKRYFWKVEARWVGKNANGDEIERVESNVAEFVTGILPGDAWKAKWIAMDRTDADPLPVLTGRVALSQDPKQIEDAFLHACGLGQQAVFINSQRVGNRTSIDPGWTNYRKTCLYVTFDVKKALTSNSVEIQIALGNGMYNVPGGRYVKFTGSFGTPKAIAELVVRYRNGEVQRFGSDESWTAQFSPVVFSCVYGGDDLDFSLGLLSKQSFKLYSEQKPVILTTSPGGELRAQQQQPVVVLENLKPIEVKTLEDGRIEANFGFNFAGRPVFRCNPYKNGVVKTTLAEMVGQPWNGHNDTFKFGDNEETQNAISANDEFVSPFGYWGFQYVYIEGADYISNEEKEQTSPQTKTQIVEISADRVGADLEKVGSFDSDGAY